MPTNDKARKAADDALQHLAAQLEAGRSEALTSYLAAMGRFRRYSWGNVLLISSQRPDATRVAGIHTWNDLGRTVKKGEKGIMILAPVVRRQAPAEKAQEAETEPESKEPNRVAGFRTAYVFDVSQTDGKPLPEFAKTAGDPKDHTDRLKSIAAARGISVEYDASIAPAMGVSSGGRVRLVPDLGKGEEFAVLVHELAHEMLHHAKTDEKLPKVVRETQAEAVAFVVCREIGLETNTAAADYIKLYNGDKKTLIESLSVIQETSAKILNELLPDERETPAAEKEDLSKQPTETHQPEQSRGPTRDESSRASRTDSLEPLNFDR